MNKENLIRVWINIEQYTTWVLCNVIFSALPIGILCLTGKLKGNLNLLVVFSSILALLFTLMIISLYTLFPFSRSRRGLTYRDLLIFASIFVAIVVLVVFVLYNVMPEAQQFMNANMNYWFFLLVALALAILLNRPAIEARISTKRGMAINDAFKGGQQKRAKWMKDIASRGGK